MKKSILFKSLFLSMIFVASQPVQADWSHQAAKFAGGSLVCMGGFGVLKGVANVAALSACAGAIIGQSRGVGLVSVLPLVSGITVLAALPAGIGLICIKTGKTLYFWAKDQEAAEAACRK
jgi:hypothetical protein